MEERIEDKDKVRAGEKKSNRFMEGAETSRKLSEWWRILLETLENTGPVEKERVTSALKESS